MNDESIREESLMSTVQKTMQLQPEYIEKFIKDILANVYQVDEETGEVTGIVPLLLFLVSPFLMKMEIQFIKLIQKQENKY